MVRISIKPNKPGFYLIFDVTKVYQPDRLLVPDIQKTAELIEEISVASKEQNTGVEQINTAIVHLNSVIQQNASSSEQIAASTEVLSDQVDQLNNLISFFRT